MDTTTVKIHQSTKHSLDEVRGENESYDEVINKLLVEMKKKNLVKELIAAYKSMGTEDLDVLEEWESASKETDESWK